MNKVEIRDHNFFQKNNQIFLARNMILQIKYTGKKIILKTWNVLKQCVNESLFVSRFVSQESNHADLGKLSRKWPTGVSKDISDIRHPKC